MKSNMHPIATDISGMVLHGPSDFGPNDAAKDRSKAFLSGINLAQAYYRRALGSYERSIASIRS
jgi:hypothetical protein